MIEQKKVRIGFIPANPLAISAPVVIGVYPEIWDGNTHGIGNSPGDAAAKIQLEA